MKMNKSILLFLAAGISFSGVLQAVSGRYYNTRIQSVEAMLDGKKAMDYAVAQKNLDELRISLKKEAKNSDRYKRFKKANDRFSALTPARSTAQTAAPAGQVVPLSPVPGGQLVPHLSEAEKNEALAAAEIADEGGQEEASVRGLPAPEEAPGVIGLPAPETGIVSADTGGDIKPQQQTPVSSPLSPEAETPTPATSRTKPSVEPLSPKGEQEGGHEAPELPGQQQATPSVVYPPKVTPIIAPARQANAADQAKIDKLNKFIADAQALAAQNPSKTVFNKTTKLSKDFENYLNVANPQRKDVLQKLKKVAIDSIDEDDSIDNIKKEIQSLTNAIIKLANSMIKETNTPGAVDQQKEQKENKWSYESLADALKTLSSNLDNNTRIAPKKGNLNRKTLNEINSLLDSDDLIEAIKSVMNTQEQKQYLAEWEPIKTAISGLAASFNKIAKEEDQRADDPEKQPKTMSIFKEMVNFAHSKVMPMLEKLYTWLESKMSV